MNYVCCQLYLSEWERPLIGLYNFLEVPRKGEVVFIKKGTLKGHYVVEDICHEFAYDAYEHKSYDKIPNEVHIKIYLRKNT